MAKKTWGIAIKIRRGLRIVQRGGLWYREERVDGRPIRRSLETSDEKEAMRKVIAGLEEPARPFLSSRSMTPAALTLEKALEEYEEWFVKSHKPSGAKTSLPPVRAFVDFVGAEIDTRAVTRDHIQNFLDKYEGRSAVYVRNEFGRLRAFLRRVERKHKDAVDLHVLLGVDLPKDTEVTPAEPDMETARAILRKLRPHSYLGDFVTVLLETGMRPGELLAVRGVDLREKLLDIKPWGSWSPKSKWSARTIQLTEETTRILGQRKERLFAKSWPLFCLPNGKMRNVKYTSDQYRNALMEDGKTPEAFEAANLYIWRHLFCSLHAQPGPAFMDLAQLAGYIGHAPGSERTLMRWYVDRDALRRGAPPSLVGEARDGKVISMGK